MLVNYLKLYFLIYTNANIYKNIDWEDNYIRG